MKLSTRFILVLALLSVQLSALAATLTLRGQGRTHATATVSRPVQDTPRQHIGLGTTPTLTARTLAPSFTIFPNPSKGLVTFSVSQLTLNTDYKLRLSNIIGREVRMVAVRPEAADGGMNLNLSDLPAGMYFYSLVQNDKVLSTKRLLLQN
ncbi:T9SS type A sorting domain-containing protein [Hymenobacter perfusus]|nr:T9SS type A sorting domain-containing protein [Hymenobacter perfusus]